MVQSLAWQLFGGRRHDKKTAGEGAESEAGGGDDEPIQWETVLTTYDMAQARIATARLGDEGIPTRIRQEGVSSALPVNIGMIGEIDIMVPEEQAEQAFQILKDTLDL